MFLESTSLNLKVHTSTCLYLLFVWSKVPSTKLYYQIIAILIVFFFSFLCAAAIYNGYPTFVISIVFIGLCTAVIGDVAGHLGCYIYLKDTVNAIAFVALGTSVPGIVIY